ncbi:fumarylacetoacetase [Burkholderia cepacia]|uniref:fumarylacetoacetate hydrolase family protein n=1 Tax=Burkholderia cepacia TaxID=292 RepID=UPI000760748B|nr:fumarylacetoacetate hydrolase family protein [Burkholderia cepacia]KVZ18410.1 fumarylacetoacetase [Burkholderia cepacia]
MKIRRIRRPDSELPVVQSLNSGAWEDLADPPEFCLCGRDTRCYAGRDGAELPFQPISFRDFMLYEKHVIDASRGYARRFVPGGYRLAALFEGLARRPFPAFRPRPLWYRQPIYYFGNHLTFVPSGSPVRSPSYSCALDYELELGFVLARPLRDATPEEATQAIGGFVVLNDLSARDVQRDEMSSGFGPQKSKHFLSSMSELVVTADEVLSEVDSLRASVSINGERIASTSTSGMRYSLGEALAHASRDEQLFPGELFGTGTLPGGSGMECGRWLQAGDELILCIDRIGEIRHSII